MSIRIRPGATHIWLLPAVWLVASGALSQTTELGPEDRELIQQRFHAAKNAEAERDFATAAEEYKFILDRYPTAVPRVYHNLGVVSYYQRNYMDAIEAFQSGLKLDPGMTASRLFLGNSYLNIELPEKALPHLEAAHDAHPTPESAITLGQVYMAHLRYTEAIESFKEALPRVRDQAGEVLYLIGTAYLRLAERIVNEQSEKYPESKDVHIAAAKLFESQKSYQVAAIKYLEAAETDPMNASIFFPLARMLAILGLEAPSRLALERYWELLPEVPRQPIDKSLLPKEQVAEIGTKVDFEGILRSLPAVNDGRRPPLPIVTGDINAELSKRLAEDPEGHWKAAAQSLFEGRFQDGLTELKGIPQARDAWLRDYLKVSAHVWLDDYRQAGEIASSAVLANQPLPSVQMLRAEVFRQLSIEVFAELVQDHPESCRAHQVKAMNFAAQEMAEAESEFKAAIEGCPFDTEIRIQLADYYLWNSRFQDARDVCVEELEVNPHSSAAKKRLGRIHVQLRDAGKALPYLNAAAEADPEDPDVRSDLGRAYELLENWDRALAEYQLALKLEPSMNRVHYVLARIYRELGKPDLAQAEFRRFREKEEAARQARVERIQRLRQREAGEVSEAGP